MGSNITHCTFYGVKWDGQAIESINNVAKALLNLTELFRAQNIQIDALLKIEPDPSIQTAFSENVVAKKAKGKVVGK